MSSKKVRSELIDLRRASGSTRESSSPRTLRWSQDPRWSPNQALSQRRADAVRAWLIAHGVGAERVSAKGYGPDKPLTPNLTPNARARNNRVEVKVLEQAEASE